MDKGGLISESFSLWFKSQKRCQNQLDHYPTKSKGPYLNYVSMVLPIFDQLITLTC